MSQLSSVTAATQQERWTINAPRVEGVDEVLTQGALSFLTQLSSQFTNAVCALLEARRVRQMEFDIGRLPDFLPETKEIRQSSWAVAPIPPSLLKRRVEITGPASSAKMMINALNSGADVYMADAEDSESPTWGNMITGQCNLMGAVDGRLAYYDPVTSKHYAIRENPAILMFRPRGLHLWEKHVQVDGSHVPAALFDAGLFLFHNDQRLRRAGKSPCLYLPKMQSHLEARLWNNVLRFCEATLGLLRGEIKVTVLIETLPAAFEMNEILWELRERCLGLNCGRWDYIFSMVKTCRAHPERVLPDRWQVGMTQPFLNAYSLLEVQTCHRRGAYAMGGMAAQIPIKRDEQRNTEAMNRVRSDKIRELENGHDGTWVAHPGLVRLALEIFDAGLGGRHNQLNVLREDVHITADMLLQHPTGAITEEGLRRNVDIGIRYLAAWLQGTGCVPLYDIMEDAATTEISRCQLWQWLHHGAMLSDGRQVTGKLIEDCFEDAREKMLTGVDPYDPAGYVLRQAIALFEKMATAPVLDDFLTIPAYDVLIENERQGLVRKPI